MIAVADVSPPAMGCINHTDAWWNRICTDVGSMTTMNLLVADHRTILRRDPDAGVFRPVDGLGAGPGDVRPTSVVRDPHSADRAWAGTRAHGVALYPVRQARR